MDQLSPTVPQSSALTVLSFLGLLGVLHSTPAGPLGVPFAGHTPCHGGACVTSSRPPMHNPG